MRKEFNNTYEQTIALVKQLKNSNDYLNRSIGVQSNSTIALRIKRQKSIIETNMRKIEDLVNKLEQSYLDPDTARKIGTVKQQFRIQKDRRKQLLASASLEQQLRETSPRSKQSQITTYQSMESEFLTKNNHEPARRSSFDDSPWSHFGHKDNEETARTQRTSVELQREEALGLSYEFQQKLMRERSSELQNVSKTLMNVHSIINQTGTLAYEQGNKIDIIGEELFETYKNARHARQNLVEANEHQKKARRKYVYFSLMVVIGVCVAVIVMIL